MICRRKGAILILALFALVVLGTAALSFSYRVGLESRSIAYRTVKTRLRKHAESALAIAVSRLMEEENEFDHPAEPWHTHGPLSAEGWLQEWSEGGTRWEPPDFVTDYQVIDEEGKLNVLWASSEALAALGMSEEQIASLFDWMDSDDVTRAEGAESDFYRRLYKPYRSKNSPVELLDELLLIRGFSTRDYYGEDADHDGELDHCENDGLASPPGDDANGVLRLGWVDVLTCVGDGRVNLNTAPRVVLATFALSEAAVDQIIGYREFDENSGGNLEDHAFRSASDIDQLQGLTESDRDLLHLIGKFRSNHFRIFVKSQHLKTGLICRLEVLVRMNENEPEFLHWKVVHEYAEDQSQIR